MEPTVPTVGTHSHHTLGLLRLLSGTHINGSSNTTIHLFPSSPVHRTNRWYIPCNSYTARWPENTPPQKYLCRPHLDWHRFYKILSETKTVVLLQKFATEQTDWKRTPLENPLAVLSPCRQQGPPRTAHSLGSYGMSYSYRASDFQSTRLVTLQVYWLSEFLFIPTCSPITRYTVFIKTNLVFHPFFRTTPL